MMKDKRQHNCVGQATVEFAFAMLIIVLILYGLIMVLRWAGLSYVESRSRQEASLVSSDKPEEQVGISNTVRARSRHLEAVYRGKLYEK